MDSRYFFIPSFLSMLARPSFVNRSIAILLRVLAGLTVPYSLVAVFKAGKVTFELPPSGILGGVLFLLVFVLAIYAVVHTLLIRAREIDGLPGADYNMFSLSAILIKLTGEAWAMFVALVGIGGAMFVWFAEQGVSTILNPLPRFFPTVGNTNFMGGIEFLVGSEVMAIVALIGAYTAAEFMNFLADWARSVTPGRRGSSSDNAMKLRSGT